ncbi:hypothetical protein BGX26_007270 [Mortierella sp. AD094]|nr:hypothetical protein BGX26_007270 [Mortierella sp. AD094]
MTKSARKKLRKQQAEAAAAAAAAATSATPPNPSVTLSSGRPKTPPSTPVSTRVTRSSMSMSSPVAQPATNRSSTAMSSPAAQPATNRSKNASPVIVSRGSAGDLQLELQPAMLEGIPIVTGNKVSRKAAGECILRAVVYTLSRNYAFISKDLFMQLYRNNFGCPGLDDKPMILDAGLLDNKMVAPIIQVQVLNHVKYYRLIPAYFERFGMPQNLHSTTKKQPTLFADHNKSKLPPIQALTPNAVMALVEDFDTRFINIATIFPELCPSRLCKSAGLQEFSRFIPLWCPELHPSATVPPKLISPTKPNSMTDDELNQLQIATVPPKLFGLLLQKARGTGMAAKRARIMLIRHSARLLQPLEDERLKIRRQLLQTHPLANTSNSPLTSTNSSGRNIPTPVPQQAEQLKDKNEVIVPSPELTTAMEDMNMDIDAQLPNFSSSTKAPESTPILNIEVTRYTADQLSVGSQQAMIHSHVLSETMDIPGETLAQEQDGTLKSGTQGHIKPSQGSQLRAMLKQERFKPYPSLNETNGGSALSKNGSSQKKALPNHSKTSGSGGSSGSAENSNHKKEMNSLGYIPPSGDGIFTLPRPILPPLEGRAGPMSGMPPMASFDPSISVAGMEESNLMMSGTLLRPTRDQILKERREALNQVIEYVWKLPMRAA